MRNMLQDILTASVKKLIDGLPAIETLSSEQQRRLIGRYAAVLEGNFIAWMTAAYLSSHSEIARQIIRDNLEEEIRDNHPGMLRVFAQAANALPNEVDYLAVSQELKNVRQFISKFSGVKILVMMAFFEQFISQFMLYLAELAERQGSQEMTYTTVHGAVDVIHSAALYNAINAERAESKNSITNGEELREGIEILRALLLRIIGGF